jgi:uncharacterized protein (DUF1330 family)
VPASRPAWLLLTRLGPRYRDAAIARAPSARSFDTRHHGLRVIFRVQSSCEIIQFAAWVQAVTVGTRSHLEEAMKTHYSLALALLAGIGIGAAAVHTLHAQAKPKAYLVTESEILDAAALAEYSPKAQANLKAAGGRGGVVPANGRIIGLIGEPPKRFGVSEWESVEQLQEYYKSPPRQALNDLRAKAQKVHRQFIVEAPAN